MPNVLIPTKRGAMPAYLASPLHRPRAGVVVLHDAGGMSQDRRSQADWLAEADSSVSRWKYFTLSR